MLALAVGVLGCGDGAETQESSSGEKAVMFQQPRRVPDVIQRSKLSLIHLNQKLYLGDEQDRLYRVFAPPPGAYDVGEAPYGWPELGFRSIGWEKGTEGFGALLVHERVGLAMFSMERTDERAFQARASEYAIDLAKLPTTIDGRWAKYRFWHEDGQTFMLCFTQTPRLGGRLTEAVGDDALMEGLRMGEELARQDAAAAESELMARSSGRR